jgi:hypothetical protein
MRVRLLVVFAFAAIGAMPVAAQPIERGKAPPTSNRYVPFPFDVDPQTLVQDRLNQLKNLQQMQDLLERIQRDPSAFQFDKQMLDSLKHLNLRDPKVQEELKPWVQKNTQGKPSVTPEDAAKFQAAIKKAVESQQAASPSSAPPAQGAPAVAPAKIELPPDAPQAPDPEAGVRDWLKNIIERAEDSNLGEWLRESPAFQKAIVDLHSSVRMPDVKPNAWGLDRLLKLDRLPMPDATTLERLGRFKPNLPNINPPSLPSISRPSLPPVSAPALPSAANLGTLATWLLCLALVALVAWQASRWINLPGRSARVSAVDIGPWPVDPNNVSTRAELVQAVDYLALLVLGTKARTWHHRAIAEAIAKRAAGLSDVAVRLAALYEQARYTDGVETLAANDRDHARQALAQLVGMASP